MYKQILKPLFFLLPAEKAHHLVNSLLRFTISIPGMKALFKRWYCIDDPKLKRTIMGLEFSNPIGLAAGFDKDAKMYDALQYTGFGFIEIGTVTPVGQDGNPQPRLFRLPADDALINRMGFNNGGVEAAVARLKKGKAKVIIGGNIGKNKVTPNDRAVEDYKKCFEALFDHVDYFVVNVSSPNTPNLRELQDKEPLMALLKTLQDLNQAKTSPKPLLLKIAPDLTNGQLDDIIEIAKEVKLSGLIATNTTIDRSGLNTSQGNVDAIGAGGLSGKPVRDRSTEVIRYIAQRSEGRFHIIGVGGINGPEDAIEKLEAGADLLQLYTGYIYEGPSVLKRINKGILRAGL